LPATTKCLSWSPRRPFACTLEGLGSYYEVFELVSKVTVYCTFEGFASYYEVFELVSKVTVCLRP